MSRGFMLMHKHPWRMALVEEHIYTKEECERLRKEIVKEEYWEDSPIIERERAEKLANSWWERFKWKLILFCQ